MSNSDSIPKRGAAFKDMKDQVFGRLRVTGEFEPGRHTPARWTCACSCGNQLNVSGNSLRRGKTNSCGCLQREVAGGLRRSHGNTGSPEHLVWKAMWARCTNPKDPAYEAYKSRRPPEAWRDFATFMRDMGPRPTPGLTLERLDNDKPYGPGNCEWASRVEQNANKLNNVYVMYRGEVMCLAEACRKSGLAYSTVCARRYQGKTMEQASGGLLTQVGRERALRPWKSKTPTQKEIA